MKILAIDYGLKRIGLAIGSIETKLALPAGVLTCDNQTELLKQIKQKILTESIDKVVVGDPMSLSGGVTDQTKITREFVVKLQTILTVPVELFDERLTSRRADAAMAVSNKTHSRDELAAMYVLQDYIDQILRSKV